MAGKPGVAWPKQWAGSLLAHLGIRGRGRIATLPPPIPRIVRLAGFVRGLVGGVRVAQQFQVGACGSFFLGRS